MFKALKRLFEEPDPGRAPGAEPRALYLAVATLLHESTRVDLESRPAEQAAAARALAALFGLPPGECEQLLAEGRQRAQQLTSYFRPVSVIKRGFSLDQRIRFVEHLWRIAYADGKLDPYEDHFVRKIAHLLYVPNTQCMVARSRAQKPSPKA